MKLLNRDDISEHREKIENALVEVLQLDTDGVQRIISLLLANLMQCWLLLRESMCIGFAITEVIYDNPSNKNLFLVYLLKTMDTATPVEVHTFYNELLNTAREQQCAALTFYTSFQNENKLSLLRKFGAVTRTHYYIAT